jgi:hypothetical protein
MYSNIKSDSDEDRDDGIGSEMLDDREADNDDADADDYDDEKMNKSDEDLDADSEFELDEEADEANQDDETTLLEEEALGERIDPTEEIAMLDRESQIPIEQLRAMYSNIKSDSDEDGETDAFTAHENEDDTDELELDRTSRRATQSEKKPSKRGGNLLFYQYFFVS